MTTSIARLPKRYVRAWPDRPGWQLYLDWLGGFACFNFGNSLVSGLPVTHEIAHLRSSHTLLLAGSAMLIALLIAALLGFGRRCVLAAGSTV